MGSLRLELLWYRWAVVKEPVHPFNPYEHVKKTKVRPVKPFGWK